MRTTTGALRRLVKIVNSDNERGSRRKPRVSITAAAEMSAAAWRGRSHHADPWHLAILNAYPQVKAVVHTHADRCVALSCLAETNVGLPFHGPRFWQKRCALCALRHVRRQSARRVSRRGAGTAQGLPIGEPRDDCHGQGAAGWLRPHGEARNSRGNICWPVRPARLRSFPTKWRCCSSAMAAMAALPCRPEGQSHGNHRQVQNHVRADTLTYNREIGSSLAPHSSPAPRPAMAPSQYRVQAGLQSQRAVCGRLTPGSNRDAW